MKILAIIGLALSVLGGIEAFRISYLHFTSVESCPCIGVPACYVVLVCYMLMTLAWITSLTGKAAILKRGFWVGLTPALVLALLGVSGEIFGFASCPKTASGLPKCFFSLAFVSIIGAAWIFPRFRKKTA